MLDVVVLSQLEKSEHHDRPVVIGVQEIDSVSSSTEGLLDEDPQYVAKHVKIRPVRADRISKTQPWTKTQELATWMCFRAKVTIESINTTSKPLSQVEKFNRYYVEPQLARRGKNERIMLGRCQPKVLVQNGRGERQTVIHAASHNYAGFYEQDSATDEIQQLCLDTLPVCNAKATAYLEAALCRKIRALLDVDFCCTTGTGYGSNLLAFPAILDKSWLVAFDEKCHNSMFAGAFQSEVGLIQKFKHNDMKQLEAILQEYSHKYEVLVAVEGAYSMDGTVPQLDRLAQMKSQYNFTLLADEAHSILSLGASGKGCIEMWNEDHPDSQVPHKLFDIRTATLSKAFGAIGGIVCGTSKFEEAVHTRRSQLLADGSEALTTAAIVQSLHVLNQPSRLLKNLRRLKAMSAFVRGELGRAGIYVYGNATTPVLPVHAGRPSLAAKLSYVLRQHGVLASPIATPAVPMWEARVRVCLSAEFDDDTVNQLVGTLVRACQMVGIVNRSTFESGTFTYQEKAGTQLRREQSEACISRQHIQKLITQDRDVLQTSITPTLNVIQAGHRARQRYGIAAGAPRWTTGSYAIHLEVETEVAKQTATEATMTFPDSYIGLMSTVAALCRPLIGYKKHYLCVPKEAPPAVLDGIKVASKKGMPTIIVYTTIESLLRNLKAVSAKSVYITLYLSTFSIKNAAVHQSLREICRHEKSPGMTILLDNHEEPEHVPEMGIVVTAKFCRAQLAVYGSFSRTFGLPGAYLAGGKQLISELRYTSRGYMYTTSPLPFVMGMIVEALRKGSKVL